jgi:CheY-like chemotaxis protein
MPDGGRLTIETSSVYRNAEFATRHPDVTAGDYCLLCVSDTGSGMDEQTAQRAFEPFFSTKERGTGTGLGLAVVHGVVKQHGGHIWLYSEPGHGTTFKIHLPKTTPRALSRPSQPAASSPRGLGEVVLVVEDSPAVRRLAVMALEHVGYHVLAAASAEEAMELVGDGIAGVDLLLTDVVLPGKNGRKLYEELARSRPDLRVLYMSGYTDNVIARHGILDEGTLLLQKPFSVEGLVRMVQRALGARDDYSAGS